MVLKDQNEVIYPAQISPIWRIATYIQFLKKNNVDCQIDDPKFFLLSEKCIISKKENSMMPE
jgi:hypothetical protein